MIIYNVTVKPAPAIAAAWLKWLQDEHIPAMMNTGCFTDARIMRLLDVDDSEGPTYAVQYFTESKAQYNRYMEHFAATQRQAGYDHWGDQFIAFRSLMEVVN